MDDFTYDELLAMNVVLRSARKQGFVDFQGIGHFDAIRAEDKILKEINRREVDDLDLPF